MIKYEELSSIICLYNNYVALKNNIEKKKNHVIPEEYYLIKMNWIEEFKKIFHYDDIIQTLTSNMKNLEQIDEIPKIDNSINIKIFSLSSQIKSYKFLPSKCPITIGRSKDNHIYIDDDMLSRIHCTIDYGNEKWYIQDGYAKNGLKEEEIKKSTNGCWIYAFDEIEIVNGMIFKSNHNIFICNLV